MVIANRKSGTGFQWRFSGLSFALLFLLVLVLVLVLVLEKGAATRPRHGPTRTKRDGEFSPATRTRR